MQHTPPRSPRKQKKLRPSTFFFEEDVGSADPPNSFFPMTNADGVLKKDKFFFLFKLLLKAIRSRRKEKHVRITCCCFIFVEVASLATEKKKNKFDCFDLFLSFFF